MKEVSYISTNELTLIEGEKRTPMAEVILVISEPFHEYDSSGTPTSTRQVENIRFAATSESLKSLSLVFAKLSEELKEETK